MGKTFVDGPFVEMDEGIIKSSNLQVDGLLIRFCSTWHPFNSNLFVNDWILCLHCGWNRTCFKKSNDGHSFLLIIHLNNSLA